MRLTEEEYNALMTKREQIMPKPRFVPPVKPQGRDMNKTEARYAREVLDPLLSQYAILGWEWESIKFRMADRTWYTPDFLVIFPTHMQIVEIKGFMRDDAVIKYKCCREMFPWFEWKMLRLIKGNWDEVKI